MFKSVLEEGIRLWKVSRTYPNGKDWPGYAGHQDQSLAPAHCKRKSWSPSPGPGAHMQWISGFHPYPDQCHSLPCLSQNGAALLMSALNAESTHKSTDIPFYEWPDAAGPKAALDHLIKDFEIPHCGKIALEWMMCADFAALIQNALPYGAPQFSTSKIGPLRTPKDIGEYRLLKRNAGISDQVMQTIWS